MTACSLEDLTWRESTIGVWKTREAYWEKRQDMMSRLVVTVATFGEGMESSRWLCAWGIQA